MAVDVGFDGMGLDDEAERLSKLLGNKRMVMMGNHGFDRCRIASAGFDLAYYFERGCRTYLTALSTGAPLALISDETAEKTACQWKVKTFTLEITLWQSETFLMKKSLNIAIKLKFLT